MREIKNIQRLPSLIEEKTNKLKLQPIKRRIHSIPISNAKIKQILHH